MTPNIATAAPRYRATMRASALLLAAACLLPVGSLTAADVVATWDGSTGNWTDFARWSSNPLYPSNGNGGFTYDVIIDSGIVTQDLLAGVTIENLTVSGGSILGEGDLTVNGLYTWTAGTMDGTGTTYLNGGVDISSNAGKNFYRPMVNAGTLTWSGTGDIRAYTVEATFTNLATGIFDIQSDADFRDAAAVGPIFNNEGILRKTGGTDLTIFGVIFNNSGTVEAQSGTLAFYAGGTHSGAFTVSSGATLQFASGTHTLDSGATVSGDGNLIFSSGQATLNDTYSITGSTTFSSGKTTFNVPFNAGPGAAFDGGSVDFNGLVTNLPSDLVIDGGSVNFNANPTVAFTTVTAAGGLGGTADITVSGLYTWTGGTMEGAGTTYANGGMVINSDAIKRFHRPIVNAGMLTWSGTGGIWAYEAEATFTNLASGTFEMQSDANFTDAYARGPAFNNAGIVRKTGGTGTTIIGVVFNNSGTVEIQTGTLALYGGGTHSGTFTISPGATLQFNNGTHTLNSGATVSGDGSVVFSGGATTLNDTYSIAGTTTFSSGSATFNVPFDAGPGAAFDGGSVYFNGLVTNLPSDLVIDGGSVNFNANSALLFTTVVGGGLGGSDDITVSGLYTWTDGTMEGTGTTYANGGMVISGDATKRFYRPVVNAGMLTWSGTGGLWAYEAGATFTNLATGTFEIQSDANFTDAYARRPAFNNDGLLRKTGGTGTTRIAVVFNNNGTVQVQSGTLQFVGGGTHAGSFTVSPGATLQFANGTHALNSGATVSGGGNVIFSNGTSTLNDTYSVTGTTTFTSGTTTFNVPFDAGPGAAFDGGTVHFNGLVTNLPSDFVINGGSVNFNANPAVAFTTVTAAGGLGGTADITVSGLYTWTGGTMTGTGTTYANGGMALTGSAGKGFYRPVVNAGILTWSGTGDIRAYAAGATFTNLATGTFEIQSDADFRDWFAKRPVFNNAGSVLNTGGAGVSQIGVVFNNSGTVEVRSGTLAFLGGGTHSGTFSVSPGATLQFGNGTHAMNSGATVSGGGNVIFSKGTATLNDTYTIAGTTTFSSGTTTFNVPFDAGPGAVFDGGTVHFNGLVTNLPSNLVINGGAVNVNANPAVSFTTVTASGGLGGTADVTVSGLYTWTGGTMNGTGTTYANGGMVISGSEHKPFFRPVVNAGTLIWSGTGELRAMAPAATFTNLSTGTFEMQSDADFRDWYASGPVFNNDGAVRKTGGTDVTRMEVGFNNNGTVDVQSGTLAFYRGGTHSGSFSVSPGATLQFGNGTHLMNSGATVTGGGNVIFSNGAATLNDTYNIAGTTTFTAGTMTFNVPFDTGAGVVFDGGTVHFNGVVTNLPSDLVIGGGAVNLNANPAVFFTTVTAAGGLGGTADVTVSGLYTWTAGTMSGTGTTYANGGMEISGDEHKPFHRPTVNAGTLTWSGAGELRATAATATFTNLATGTFEMLSDANFRDWHSTNPVFNNEGIFRKTGGTDTTRIEVVFNSNGTVEVQSGTLEFTGGGTQAGPLTVSAGATLALLTGMLTVNPSTQILGDLTFGTGAILETHLIPDDGDDPLHVAGHATLAGLLTIEPIGAVAGTYTLMTYGSRTGTFTFAGLGAYGGDIVYDDTAGEMRLTLLDDVLNGDANMDFAVDDIDLSILLSNWGIGNRWALGDFTDDGTVGDDDLAVLLGNWTGVAVAAQGNPVPEPSTLALLALGTLTAMRRKRR